MAWRFLVQFLFAFYVHVLRQQYLFGIVGFRFLVQGRVFFLYFLLPFFGHQVGTELGAGVYSGKLGKDVFRIQRGKLLGLQPYGDAQKQAVEYNELFSYCGELACISKLLKLLADHEVEIAFFYASLSGVLPFWGQSPDRSQPPTGRTWAGKIRTPTPAERFTRKGENSRKPSPGVTGLHKGQRKDYGARVTRNQVTYFGGDYGVHRTARPAGYWATGGATCCRSGIRAGQLPRGPKNWFRKPRADNPSPRHLETFERRYGNVDCTAPHGPELKTVVDHQFLRKFCPPMPVKNCALNFHLWYLDELVLLGGRHGVIIPPG